MNPMKTDNYNKMLEGKPYICDEYCTSLMLEAKRKLHRYNSFDFQGDDCFKKLDEMMRSIVGKAGDNVTILPPFHCDYGSHITVGDNFFANYNLTILDVAKVTIGDNVFIAPNVSIYTAGHPVHPKARNSMYEYGAPVTIGSNCWIGGNVVICPGVTIGEGTVIGAGSVVTHDISPNVVAAGNPCRILRPISAEDMNYYFKSNRFSAEELAEICGKA